jgi:LysM domain/Penicillin-insensitive murein endopeptidase
VRFAPLGVALFLLAACSATTHVEQPSNASSRAAATDEVRDEPGHATPNADDTTAVAASDDTDEPDEPDEPDDESEETETPPAAGERRPHPLDGWSDAQVAEAVKEHLASLGSMSVGNPNAGLLVNGHNAQKSDLYAPVAPGTAWGTEETLAYLDAALRQVHTRIADTQALQLGDISARSGGPISPHLSHQSGRDVDIAYFYVGEQRWYRRGNAENLDLPRNWAFIRALVTETDVELIFMDTAIQALLRDYALSIGENRAWVEGLFGGGGQRAIIRYARGHATHVHVRFYNPVAQETARRSYAALVERGVVPPVQSYLQHVVKKGDTLGKISKKYGVSVEAIKRANRLKKSLIREKHVVLIPVAHPRPAPPAQRLAVPPRRLPPSEPDARAAALSSDGR